MTDPWNCRSCGSADDVMLLDLGLQPLANNLLRAEDVGKPEPRFPLRLFVCPQCWLLQIADMVSPVQMFSEYLYFSSFSDAMLRHAREAAQRYMIELGLGAQSLVVEIASNDGYLLQNFADAGVPCLGVEPAANIADVARAKGIETVVEFFGEALARDLVAAKSQADLILGNNVFAHAPFINDFVSGLKALFKPQGRIILEFPYAVELIGKNEFDTIYHEHVFYFTASALVPLLARHGLEIFHVEHLPIHGGSLRLFGAHAGEQKLQESVQECLAREERLGVTTRKFYDGFGQRVQGIRDSLLELLHRLKAEGCSIAAYGASAKGSTLLNYCGIGKDLLDFVVDRSTYKQGLFTPGTHLPILATEELARRKPDYTLLLTWNFADEILVQQQTYRDQGGKFIVPVPQVRVV